MSSLLLIVAIIFALSFVPLAYVLLKSYGRYRGARVVTCPETKQPVAVEVSAGRAAVSGLFEDPQLRLSSCTRWPERQSCGQECVSQIEGAPDGCLVRDRLAEWYRDSRCALCGRTIGAIRWTDRKPGLLTPDLRTLEWSEVAPQEIPTVLLTHKPICWSCQVAESFLRRYPDRVVKDPRKPAPRESESGANSVS